jgi:hypothetical protein
LKNKWIYIFISVIIVLSSIYYVVFRAPYNLQDNWFKDSFGITNINSFKEIDELAKYFNGYKIEKVEYKGSHTYDVKTDKGEFIVIADYSDSTYWKYKIFKYNKQVKFFTNPM